MYILQILESLPQRFEIAISHASLHAMIIVPDPIETFAPPPSALLCTGAIVHQSRMASIPHVTKLETMCRM